MSQGTRLRVSFDPALVRVVDRLKGAEKTLSELRPVMARVNQGIQAGVRRNIDSRGATVNERWDQYNPAYLARKAAKGRGSTPMRFTGALDSQIRGGGGSTVKINKKSTSLELNLSYIRAINFGLLKPGESRSKVTAQKTRRRKDAKTAKHRGGIGRRPFFLWSSAMQDMAIDTTSDEVFERVADLLDAT